VTDTNYGNRIFGETLKIDTRNIVAVGHSLGGTTAIALGRLDKRVAAVISLDPWYYPVQGDIEKGKFKFDHNSPPLLIIPTSSFPAKQLTRSKGVDEQA